MHVRPRMLLRWLGRRTDVRARVCALARVWWPGRDGGGEHLVENLSAGGAYLIGRSQWAAGDRVRLAIALPEGEFAADARVLRAVPDARVPGFAVRFESVGRRERAAIEDEVLAQVRRRAADVPRVLVIERTPARAEAVLELVSPLRSFCLVATDPRDAAWLVGRWNVRVGLLGLTRGGATRAPFPDLARRYPNIVWRMIARDGRLLRAGPAPVLPEAELAALAVPDAPGAASAGAAGAAAPPPLRRPPAPGVPPPRPPPAAEPIAPPPDPGPMPVVQFAVTRPRAAGAPRSRTSGQVVAEFAVDGAGGGYPL